MKPTMQLVALMTLFSTSLLQADSAEIVFDAALTNRTGWTYAPGFEHVETRKMYCFKSSGDNIDQVVSPVYDFAITSVVIQASKASPSTTRKVSIRPTSGSASPTPTELVYGVVGADEIAFTAAKTWMPTERVRSFALRSTGGSGNIYLISAAISGVPLISSPYDLEVTHTYSKGFVLNWSNDDSTVSNRITVCTRENVPESGSTERKYDFDEFSNGGTTSDQTDYILSVYRDLSGSSLYLPTNSTGQIQLSNSDTKGALLIPGFSSCANLLMVLSARHYNHAKEVKTLSVGYVQDGLVTDFATVELAAELAKYEIALDNVPDDAQIVLNNGGNKTCHRVILDEISFVRDYAPAHTTTNMAFDATIVGTTTAAVSSLEPATHYFADVTSFGHDGAKSRPTVIEVTTKEAETGFIVRMQ